MSDHPTKSALPEWATQAMLDAAEGPKPSEDQKQSMLARIKSKIERETQPEPDPLSTVSADDGEWIEPAPGNHLRMLRGDEQTQSFLVRLDPGTRFPAHYHPDDEETYVLEGSVIFGDIPLSAGDYHHAPKGSHHGEVYSEAGCLLLIRAATAQNA